MKNNVELHEISGGVIPAYVAYPLVGCGTNMCLTYWDNPDASSYELGKSCGKGAIHGMNPGFGIVGKMMTNPHARYGIGIAYARYAPRAIDYLMPSELANEQMNQDPHMFALGDGE